ncbi:unnamed protein product [Albugo candida]|uniref:Uncharacterized protein n=1 Tax=Albugo candida TaxID=65357 RepID=A0A024FWA9_9STRA|nr:unnamed protein product [Albugo candida]|eukprot:CCI11326.1 unnamed protein product [Albugo candida]
MASDVIRAFTASSERLLSAIWRAQYNICSAFDRLQSCQSCDSNISDLLFSFADILHVNIYKFPRRCNGIVCLMKAQSRAIFLHLHRFDSACIARCELRVLLVKASTDRTNKSFLIPIRFLEIYIDAHHSSVPKKNADMKTS